MNATTTNDSSVVSMNMGGPMNAITAAPDWSHVAVAGRDVLKIVKLVESDGAGGEVAGYPSAKEINLIQQF